MQHDFILLDRSGSMAGSMWTESLNSINTYVKKLADDNVDTGVTLVVFDSNEPFKIIRDRITSKTWRAVTNDDAMPRGGTPLNDATGALLDLAEKGSPFGGPYEKVSIVIVTDGNENASQEYSIASGGTAKIKSRLDACRAKNWQITYLGANFDNQAQGMSYGATRGMTISASAGNMADAMTTLSTKRGTYGLTGQSMSWTDQEKTAAATPKAKENS